MRELVDAGLADPLVAATTASGDWYLTGSRAGDMADEHSDWDTIVVLRPGMHGQELSRAHLDRVFGVQRPRLSMPPTLAEHTRWRDCQGVDVEPVDADARAQRERDGLAQWAHELRHVVPLRLASGFGEQYRRQVADRFTDRRPELTDRAYRAFRLARNQSAASLAREDAATQALTTAHCVTEAAKFWILAIGQPHPSDKWLLAALDRLEGTDELLTAIYAGLDPSHPTARRFDALWHLWRLVDQHAQQTGIDPTLLTGSPFAG